MSAGKMVTLPDGSVVFTDGVPGWVDLEHWVQDAADPRRYHPRFVPCRYRQKSVGVKPCGAISVCWFCEKKGQAATVPLCEVCDVDPKT